MTMNDKRLEHVDTRFAYLRFYRDVRDEPPLHGLRMPAVVRGVDETWGSKGMGKWTLLVDFLDDLDGWFKAARVGWLATAAPVEWLDPSDGEVSPFYLMEGPNCVGDGFVPSSLRPDLSKGDEMEISEEQYSRYRTALALRDAKGGRQELPEPLREDIGERLDNELGVVGEAFNLKSSD